MSAFPLLVIRFPIALRLRSSLFALAQASSSLLLCNRLGILIRIRTDERRIFPDV
jgi:hypothetical protein